MKEEREMQKKTQKQISELNRTIEVHEKVQNKMQNQIEKLQKIPEDTTPELFIKDGLQAEEIILVQPTEIKK